MLEFLKKIFRREEKIQKDIQEFNKDVIAIGNEFISSSAMLLDKELSGDFYCSDEFVIDVNANITGNIVAACCVVKGRINGNVLSPEKIIIKSTAIIEGEITAGTAEIESGARINGCIKLQRGLQVPTLAKKVKEAYQDESRQQLSDFGPSSLLIPEKEESVPIPKEPVGSAMDNDSAKKQVPKSKTPDITGNSGTGGDFNINIILKRLHAGGQLTLSLPVGAEKNMKLKYYK